MPNEGIAVERIKKLFDGYDYSILDEHLTNGVICACGYIRGKQVYAFSQNSEVMGGALGERECKKINALYSLAVKTGCPIIGIYDSDGIMLGEGFKSINAYGEIIKSAARASGVIPQLSVVASSCVGASAVMAGLGDIVIITENSDFYPAAPSDITAVASAEKGCADYLVKDFDEAAKVVASFISFLPSNNLSPVEVQDYAEPEYDSHDVLLSIADRESVTELKKNYASEIVTALATVQGSSVGIINYGGEALTANAAYKAEGFIKLCDAFVIPIISIADSNGYEKNNDAEMLVSAVKITSAYAGATCPKLSVITEKSIGGAFITLAGKGSNSDFVIATQSSVISPLEVDSAVAFMYSDRLKNGEDREVLKQEYISSEASPYTAAQFGTVDKIINAEDIRDEVISALSMLGSKRETTIPRKHSVK